VNDPRNFSAENVTELDGRRIQTLASECGPEFQLIAVAVAAVAVIPARGDVDGEGAFSMGSGFVQRACPIPLITRPTRGYEVHGIENLLHGDLGT
jgi:hypothetical protein